MSSASVFKNYVHLVEHKSIIVITKDIKEGKYKEQVEAIRKLIAEGQETEADKLKKQLLAFTPSGTFENGRKAELLSQYSEYVILDLDDLNPVQLEEAKKIVALAPYTFAVFISPSGNGLKIIVAVNSKAEHHKIAFQQVSDYYAQALQVEVDQSGKDVSRLCFMSYDPDCFRNINAEKFNVNIELHEPKISQKVKQPKSEEPKKEIPPISDEIDWLEVFGNCVDFTDRKLSYDKGNRNNYLHLLACNCNRAGIPKNIAEAHILQNFDLDPQEAIPTIQSAYDNNIADFAKFADFAKNTENIPQSKDEFLMNMPMLPDEVFDKLPEILKQGAAVFQDRRERDVFLTGALSIISGCMRNVVGLYRAKEHFANLFVFIIAPAASGKGSLTFAKVLGDKFHDKLVAESLEQQKIYKIELQEYKRKINDKKQDTSELAPPEEPPFKVLFIPANNSSARVIQHLKEGDEQGIFCETEADTMGAVFKQDWGSYSDLLRKAFHHEPISYSRKTNKEWVEIKKPRLSVALAGTPGQVENLIKSAEDGLFSRFIFYTFKSEIVWVKASDTMNGINLTAHFEQLSDTVLQFVGFLETYDKINFKLSENQWEKLNEFGENCLNSLATFVSEDLSSTSKRLGLILYRVAMVITALRYFDNGEIANEYHCTDEDFELALSLVKVYQDHSVFMFKELPKQATVTDKLLKQFFEKLATSFRRKEAITLAEAELGIKERTADLYLSKLVAFKWIEKTRNGIYQKIKH
ncbi:DUF3987 domain-containing protein [Flavobacterium sp.]|uniref:DUF3987 domain-containing protein n=1 Tax=Flavobacterium sp. TaxID=239 RepID=UPI003BEC4913